jgi:homoserine kinase
MEGEVIASGARHADNIAPALYGGFTLVRALLPAASTSWPCPRRRCG